MNTISEKRKYNFPDVLMIKLDREISLVLVSGDPEDPYASNVPEFLNSDPLKNNIT
mgnify:CR=1 FL=1